MKRHPNLFKSIAPFVSINVPHQFQDSMNQKTEEFSGDLYTKSESRTEDLIEMMSDVQEKLVHKFINDDKEVDCFERKIVSGDQKTEKNSHFGILSKLDESTLENQLQFLIVNHEYFHQSMALADVEHELFRDSSRGLEGGSYFIASLLNRKDARSKKGKEAIDAIEEYLLIKADARFCHIMFKKYGLKAETDNTPSELKSAPKDKKLAYIHELVASALRDLLPLFKNAQDKDPELIDHPVGTSSQVILTFKTLTLC